jgi:hypothetical protein
MKKIFLLAILAIGVIFNACNPMQDINDELEKAMAKEDATALFLKDRQVAPEAYTLADEDYELSSNEDVANYKNFSKYVLPKDYLPEILNLKFSGEDAQQMMVTYNFYERPVVDEENAYEISDDEYEEMGQGYPNFEDEDEAEALIGKLLDRKIYASEKGVEKTVMYTFYSRYEDRYVHVKEDGTAEEVDYDADAIEVTDDIYEATGNGKYKNFYTINNALEDLAKYAVDSSLNPITYKALVYNNYLPEYIVYMYNGNNWMVKQSVMPRSEPLNYDLNEDNIAESTWWADPAIQITLVAADYDSNDLTSRYDNFDLRSGQTPGPDRDKLVEMIGGMLDLNYNPVENQQYLVTYAYYDGSSGQASIRLVKEGGVWKEYIQ